MFEKEAKEYAGQSCFTEMPNPSLSESIDISDDIKEAVMFGYNKANEWHYVKDGDLPKVNELVLIKITGCFVLGWTNGTNWFNDSNNGTIIDKRMIYAWKEIVLP